MLATHQIVTIVLLSIEEKIDNVLTHCKIAVFPNQTFYEY